MSAEKINLRKFDWIVINSSAGKDSQAMTDELVRMAREQDVLDRHGRILATHIAHEGNPTHEDLDAFARRHGYEVAYDGLVLKI